MPPRRLASTRNSLTIARSKGAPCFLSVPGPRRDLRDSIAARQTMGSGMCCSQSSFPHRSSAARARKDKWPHHCWQAAQRLPWLWLFGEPCWPQQLVARPFLSLSLSAFYQFWPWHQLPRGEPTLGPWQMPQHHRRPDHGHRRTLKHRHYVSP